MRASTAFMVGVGTVGIAISGGLGGGLLIGNMMNPSPPKHVAEAAQPRQPASPPPLPSSSPLPYTAATLALTDPAMDGRAASRDKQDNGNAASPAAAAASTPPAATSDQQAKPASAETSKPAVSEQAAKPADNPAPRQPAAETQPAPATKQAAGPEDAFARARDADLKHADNHRGWRSQRWADRRRHDQEQAQDQNKDQSRDQDQAQDQSQNQNRKYSEQGRDDRSNGDRGNGDGATRYSYSYGYSDRRYRDDRGGRYRNAERGDDDDRRSHYDDRGPPRYYVDESPRFDFPNVQLFGPDD